MTPGAAPKIQIPRWIQLVGLPLLLILAWVVAGRVFHVVFLFLVATLIALLLDPLVKAIGAIQIGRFRSGAAFGRDRVPRVAGGADRRHLGSRHRRRRSDEDGRQPVRHLLYGPSTDEPARPPPTGTSTGSSTG
jgi:hypothetical protein